MSAIIQKMGNVCIWCAVAGIVALTAITASVLIWVGMM